MHHDPAKKLKEIDKKIILFSMLDATAFIAVVLAMYAKFSGYVPIHPILNNEQVIHSIFISGGAIML